MLKGAPPLFASDCAGRTGSAQPQMTMELDWARDLRPDLDAMRQYAKAVYQAATDYVNALTPDDLDRELDLSALGFGSRTVSWMLLALILGHLNNMAGEISALKGTQGACGYPF